MRDGILGDKVFQSLHVASALWMRMQFSIRRTDLDTSRNPVMMVVIVP